MTQSNPNNEVNEAKEEIFPYAVGIAEITPKRRSRRGGKSIRLPRSESMPVPFEQESQPRCGRTPKRKEKSRPENDWSVSQFDVGIAEDKTRFHDLGLPDRLLHAISDIGFEYCTPIQADILPSTLSGRDASGRAQTGTGKTAAFLITLIARMLNNPIHENRASGAPRALILAPTRELVLQITQEALLLAKYTELRVVSVFGGMDYGKQKKQLSSGPVDIVVATPGRLLDFQRQHEISLKKVEILVIDEADRMLDMGFIPDLRKIVYSTPNKDKRQTLLFSATLTEEVIRLAAQWTRDSISIEIEPDQVAVETVDHVVYTVTSSQKFALLYNTIVGKNLDRVLVFCNRKDEVARLADMLSRHGINCSMLSGDIPQKIRTRHLDQFKAGKIRVLVATDVAGRGIHIDGMDYVFNFSLPHDPESYVHRIGRTGRAGASGTAFSFADERDSFYIPAIEEFIKRKLSCTEPEAECLIMPEPIFAKGNGKPPAGRRSRPADPGLPSRRKRGRRHTEHKRAVHSAA